ncbi:hypothetical protein Tco_0153948 [Tanacetum coccineum]
MSSVADVMLNDTKRMLVSVREVDFGASLQHKSRCDENIFETQPESNHHVQNISSSPCEPITDKLQRDHNETLTKNATFHQCSKEPSHEIYHRGRKSIQEVRYRKRKDKEKLKDKIPIGFKNDRMRSSVVAFSKRKAKSKKNKQGCVGMDEGASVNDVDDEFSKEENSFSESKNISNIGKSLGTYIGENQKDFSNNKSFKEFLHDLKHHCEETKTTPFKV